MCLLFLLLYTLLLQCFGTFVFIAKIKLRNKNLSVCFCSKNPASRINMDIRKFPVTWQDNKIHEHWKNKKETMLVWGFIGNYSTTGLVKWSGLVCYHPVVDCFAYSTENDISLILTAWTLNYFPLGIKCTKMCKSDLIQIQSNLIFFGWSTIEWFTDIQTIDCNQKRSFYKFYNSKESINF